MWNGPYSWYLPFLMGVVFLVYIMRGLKQSSMELGLQQNQSVAALDFCLFSSSFCQFQPPPFLWGMLNSASPALSVLTFEPIDFWLSDKCSTTDRTCLLPSSQHTCNQSCIFLLRGLLPALHFSSLSSAIWDMALFFFLIFGEYFCSLRSRLQNTLELWLGEAFPCPSGTDLGIFQGKSLLSFLYIW